MVSFKEECCKCNIHIKAFICGVNDHTYIHESYINAPSLTLFIAYL